MAFSFLMTTQDRNPCKLYWKLGSVLQMTTWAVTRA